MRLAPPSVLDPPEICTSRPRLRRVLAALPGPSLAALCLAAAPAAAQNVGLTTTYAGGNGQAGNLFDVVAEDDVVVTRLDLHLDPSPYTVAIYATPGGYGGKESDLSQWQLLGLVPVQGLGSPSSGGAPTPVPLTLSVPIGAGETVGFLVVCIDGQGMNYTNGTSEGAVFATGGTLSVLEGKGITWPTLLTFSPRVWNGTIYYQIDCNGNGVLDSLDLFTGTSADCDQNGVPDECDLAGDPYADVDGDGQLDACVPPPLVADAYGLSLGAGGTVTMTLTTPFAAGPYLLLGTTSGTSPGQPLAGGVLPLNQDAYFDHTLANPGGFPLSGSFSLLTPTATGGGATTTFTLPPAFDPLLVGLTLHHAYVVLDPATMQALFASNAVPLALGT